MTLSVSDLTYSYEKNFPVLENISFSIKKGQFVGIFGPNGGGKTTLLRLLLGFIEPEKGKVELLGQSPEKVRVKIGYVPQVRRFDKQFPISVIEVVLQGCLSTHRFGSYSKESKEKAYQALERVKLQEKAGASFGSLSGGQIQRTLLARALVSEPEILLLDEATVGIDPNALAEIFDFLISLKGKITILMVTHELQLIAKQMHQLLCINRDITHFTPTEVCEHFAMGLYHPTLFKREEKND